MPRKQRSKRSARAFAKLSKVARECSMIRHCAGCLNSPALQRYPAQTSNDQKVMQVRQNKDLESE
ncbi:MAG: hypothetical protein CMM07_12675 [Rhodopirellula sp.]|nr:hypothetical protein [Rhodopirellula sp.]